MKRILIVNVNWRGDVLFSTPFIRAIRENFPTSFIACLVVPRCAEILEHNPHLNELIILEEEQKHKSVWGKLKLINLLRWKHFDTAFLLHRSSTRALICWLAGIKERVGYYTSKRAWVLTKAIPNLLKPVHKVEYFLNIARGYGLVVGSKDYTFFINQQNQDYISSLLQKHNLTEADFLVVLNPGGNWDLKRWPKENFAQLGDRLIKQYQAKVIITGAKSDLRLAQEIAAQMQNQPLIFCGQTSLGELAVLMAKVNLVIANDSGPMHIAVSQKTKTIALFGPTSPKITGPYGSGNYIVIQKEVGCPTPCYQLDCNDSRCMKSISVEDVLEVVKRMVNT